MGRAKKLAIVIIIIAVKRSNKEQATDLKSEFGFIRL